MVALAAIAQALALVVLIHGIPWTLLSLLALRRPHRPPSSDRYPHLSVIVPAHNEELLLGRCLHSIARCTYPHRVDVLVVADNCTDGTAQVARRHGAATLERNDPERPGKSYALDAGLAYLATRESRPEAVVFIDADSEVEVQFLEELGRTLAAGASAVQAYYQPTQSRHELNQLRRLAFALVHWARPLGMSRLGMGTGIKGNGFALRWEFVEDGFGAAGLAEDAALTLSLAQRGVPVRFVPTAVVAADMATSYRAGRVQDERWERGRLSLISKALLTSVVAAKRRQWSIAAAALDVASLPLSLLTLVTTASVVAGAVAGTPLLPALAAGSLASYVIIGAAAARVPVSSLVAFRHAPRYVLHKAFVYLSLLRPGRGWVRTDRSAPGSPGNETP
jgi:cellulose synthase/poly-beta-1,6-N-acetylglucosamine synthase-like glycosyltransferase